jgi:hypothetical protein
MNQLPSIVPPDDDRDVYLVLDDFGGRLGRAWAETDEDNTDREVLLDHMMSGHCANPSRVITFNLAQGWVKDASEDIAAELCQRCVDRGEVPQSLRNFLQRYQSTRRPNQLRLRL